VLTETLRLRPSQFRYGDRVTAAGRTFTVVGVTYVKGGVRVDDTDGGSRRLNGRFKFDVEREVAR
jgi:hypothetical protein